MVESTGLENRQIKKFDNISWNSSIIQLHRPENIGKYKSNFYKRLAFDEIWHLFLCILKLEKNKKIKNKKIFNLIIKILLYLN